MLRNSARVSKQLLHVQDWIPTLLGAFDERPEGAPYALDGVNAWPALNDPQQVARNEVLHMIDPFANFSALRQDNWKITLEVVARLLEAIARHSETVVPNRAKPADPKANPALYGGFYVPWMDGLAKQGSPSFGLFDNEWSGSDESVGAEYDLASVQSSPVAAAFAKTSHRLPSKDEILRLRKEATKLDGVPCNPLGSKPCLFDLKKDYCENVDVAAENPEVVARLLEALARHSETVVPNRAKPADPRANPALHGGFYVPWLDGIEV
ncbi:hypothetical protein B566_EDAN018937 [Ephemera danica]|nr:hypothetical protein B566_EDAN018937 [Ephemera danica]